MPTSPPPRKTSSSPRISRQAEDTPGPRTPSKSSKPAQGLPSQRPTQRHAPRSTLNLGVVRASTRPAPTRRNTTQLPPRTSRNSTNSSGQTSRQGAVRRRTTSPPNPSSRGERHVLIPVPIRTADAMSPTYIRAPSGQRVDFLFTPPKKKGLIGRLLDKVEWGGPEANRPYRYRHSKPKARSSPSRPFYKKLLP